jgi:hypothetical protein
VLYSEAGAAPASLVKGQKKPPSHYDSVVSELSVVRGKVKKNTPTSHRDSSVVLEAGVILVVYPSL